MKSYIFYIFSDQARDLLDKFCRNPNITGNFYNKDNQYTPASRKRCGNRSPENPTEENHCFCDSVDEQARKYYYS